MRVIETTVYTFDELSEEAKEHAIEKNREVNVEYWEWYDDIYLAFKEKYSGLFDIEKIYFSGFYSQGDGAMFEYNFVTDKLINEFIEQLPLSPLRKKLIKEHIHFSGSGTHKGNYHNERSCYHRLFVEYNGIIDYGRYTKIDTFIHELQLDYEHYIEERYIELAQILYSMLESEYEWHTSDKAVSECLIDMEYEFTENGELL